VVAAARRDEDPVGQGQSRRSGHQPGRQNKETPEQTPNAHEYLLRRAKALREGFYGPGPEARPAAGAGGRPTPAAMTGWCPSPAPCAKKVRVVPSHRRERADRAAGRAEPVSRNRV